MSNLKTYHYVLFLRHPVTLGCINMEVSVDSIGFLSFHDLLEKFDRNKHKIFKEGYTLVSMMVSRVEDGGQNV